MSKTEFIELVTDIMSNHSIDSEQAFYLLAKSEKVHVDLDAVKMMDLFNKNLLKPGGSVNTTVAFRTTDLFKNESSEIEETKVCISPTTLIMVEALFKKLVPEKEASEEYIISTAKKYLKGDLTAARYFIFFQCLFPMKSKSRNKKWNNHFGIDFDGTSRQDKSASVISKFKAIYKRKQDSDKKPFDFGYFLLGTWLYMKESVDTDRGDCFCLKPNKFLPLWQDHYDIAVEYVETIQKRKALKAGTVKAAGPHVDGL